MGLKEWLKKNQENQKLHGQWNALYNGYSIIDGEFSYFRSGAFRQTKVPVAGATAEFDSGTTTKKMSLGRVAAGGILLGPAGALLGGLAKKDKSKVYAAIVLADGESIFIEAPKDHESKLRKFVMQVNAAGIHYAAVEQDTPPT